MKTHLSALVLLALFVDFGFAQVLSGLNPIRPLPPGERATQTDIVLTKIQLREIDRLVLQLSNISRELHDEYHEHLDGVRHAQKLDDEITALERMSDSLHTFAETADGSPKSMMRFRSGTNDFIQLAVRIARTIDLTEPWLRGGDARVGTRHMRIASRNALETALAIDSFLPVDTHVIDDQAEILEAAIKELHDEFHEHLEGYELAVHLDEDLESVESLVEHMHELAHEKAWDQIDFVHLASDVKEVFERTAHIESLFVRQAEIGVRTRDWIGIEHARDAITDVVSSAYLLDHMIQKTLAGRQTLHRRSLQLDRRPMRDRHGHPVNPIQESESRYHRRHSHGIR